MEPAVVWARATLERRSVRSEETTEQAVGPLRATAAAAPTLVERGAAASDGGTALGQRHGAR